MSMSRVNRRAFVFGATAVGAAATIGSGFAFAQDTTDTVESGGSGTAGSVTTDVFGRTVAWTDAWRGPSGNTARTTNVIGADGAAGAEVEYDAVGLNRDLTTWADILLMPAVAEGENWEVPNRLPVVENQQTIDAGALDTYWYSLDYFVHGGQEYASFLKGTYGEAGVDVVTFAAPAASFGTELEQFLSEVTIDDAPAITGVDAAGLQAAIDPFLGGGGETEVEATPAS